MSGGGKPILVASHPRSGTHLLMDLLRRQFVDCGVRVLPLGNPHDAYLSLDRFNVVHHRKLDEAGARRILARAARPTLKSHGAPGFEDVEPGLRGFVEALVGGADRLYCVRDGRAVLCSMHAWMQNFRGHVAVPFSEFIRQRNGEGRTRPAEWAEHVRRWVEAPGVTVVRFERVRLETGAVLEEVEGALGMRARRVEPLLPRPVRGWWGSAVMRATGRLESTNIHNGRFVPMKPAEAFGEEDLAFFMEEAGEMMGRMGYV